MIISNTGRGVLRVEDDNEQIYDIDRDRATDLFTQLLTAMRKEFGDVVITTSAGERITFKRQPLCVASTGGDAT